MPSRRHLPSALALGLALLAPATSTPALAVNPVGGGVEGSAGVGDPLFPLAGNGGIDVRHYAIDITWDFAARRLTGRTRVTLVPTQDLRRFDLDLVMPVRSVRVGGRPAIYDVSDGHELQITPDHVLPTGVPVTVTVRYAGRPAAQHATGVRGAVGVSDDEVRIAGEPRSATWWYAANDHPSDKATYDVRITVPRGRQAISNGELVSQRTTARGTTWHWRATDPMVTYLSFFTAGRFDLSHGTTPRGLDWVDAVSHHLVPSDRRVAMHRLHTARGIEHWYAVRLGAYPFAETGGVVSGLGSAQFGGLEAQTRVVYVGGTSTGLIAHETAHAWFGNDVSVAQWPDIVLNEGFASFAAWWYVEGHGGPSAQTQLRGAYDGHGSGDSFWRVPIGSPDRAHLFDGAVYLRGAMSLQALRHLVGEQTFRDVLRTYLGERGGANAAVSDFEEVAARVSGRDLGAFFDAWWHSTTKPADTAANGL